MKYILLIIPTIFMLGCNENESTTQIEASTLEQVQEEVRETKVIGNYIISGTDTLIHSNPEVYNLLEYLDSTYSKSPYFFISNNKSLIYVCNGTWEENNYEHRYNYHNGANLKYGIVNLEKEEVLPLEYDKIYNPDLTANGYIEIEKNNKLGLYNYSTKQIIPCEYDVIFPPIASEIAIGKIGDEYFYIEPDGKSLIKNPKMVPSYVKMLKIFNFNQIDSTICHLIDSYYTDYKGDPGEGNGIVVTPSYIYQLGAVQEIQTGLIIKGQQSFGIAESSNRIIDFKKISKDLYAYITLFYEEGIDGRGYQKSKKHVVIVNDGNEVIGSKRLSEYNDYNEFYFCNNDFSRVRFTNDSIMEIREYQHNPNDYQKYRTMPSYTYYKIDDDGKFIELISSRTFNYTKYQYINESYFEDCFTMELEENAKPGNGNVYQLDHLSIEDLDIMRNEIFAEYGYRFKSDKWITYFKSKFWYLAQHDNVDSLISEIDKFNIDIILKAKEKLKKNGAKIINKRRIDFGMAG